MPLSYAFSAARFGRPRNQTRVERRPKPGGERNRCAREQPRKLRACAQNKP